MARIAKKLTTTGYIIRHGKKIKLKDLPLKEQKHLANIWNNTAMNESGFTPISGDNRH